MEGDPHCVLQDSRSSKKFWSVVGLGRWFLSSWGSERSLGFIPFSGILLFSQSWCLKNCLTDWHLFFAWSARIWKLCWHFGTLLSLYTQEYMVHTLHPPQMTVQRCEGKVHINSSHMSERRCSDKNVLFAMRFKTHAAKTTSVFRPSAFMPRFKKKEEEGMFLTQLEAEWSVIPRKLR